MTTTDQTGHTYDFTSIPKRIVSLVPSQTELLADLGLEHEVVGITRFCVHPAAWHSSKTRIGGTKDPRIDQILALQPDLVIANKEENNEADVIQLRKSCPVWVSDVNNLDSALEMIHDLGELTGTKARAESIVDEIRKSFEELALHVSTLYPTTHHKAIYFIWKDPWMVAGRDTFIADMLRRCGWINAEPKARYPEWHPTTSDTQGIDLVLLSSEPYPFQNKHIEELRFHFPNAKIQLVDGEFFSWYGSRLRNAPAYFRKLIDSI